MRGTQLGLARTVSIDLAAYTYVYHATFIRVFAIVGLRGANRIRIRMSVLCWRVYLLECGHAMESPEKLLRT
jgi:hypothetical protein